MTEKKPVKRGVLSGLMGLFGEEEAEAEGSGAMEREAPNQLRDAATPPEGPPPGEVVREAYEPGWYRISAAMPSAHDNDDEYEEQAPPPAVQEPVAEEPVVEEPEPVAEEPVVEEPEPVAEEPVVEEPVAPEAEPTFVEAESVVEEPAAQEPEPMFVDPGTVEVEPGAGGTEPVAEHIVAEPVMEEAAPEDDGDPRLRSRNPLQRRAGIEAAVADGVSEANAGMLVGVLQDPDRDVRVLALEGLARAADLVDPWIIRQVLQDPVDEVRAAAVRLALMRRSADVPEALAFVSERHWPAAQLAALESLPVLAVRTGIPDEALQALLSAIGRMDSQPMPHEQGGLEALARAIGPARLAGFLSAPDQAGLGAGRLLFEEGSAEALSALAEHSNEADPEMQHLVAQAAERRGPSPGEMPTSEAIEPEPDSSPAAGFQTDGPDDSVEEDMLTGLARALEDPGPSVRDRAREALAGLAHDQVAGWVSAALASEDPERAALGAQVAGAARLSDLAPLIAGQALSASAENRPSFVRALSELAMPPESYVGLLTSASAEQRPDAVRLLWQVAGRAILPQLRSFLEDPSAQVRMAALEVIGESGESSAMEVARSVLERDSSPVVRATAIHVIGRAGLDQREASLTRALADPDPDVRAMAVEILPTGLGGHAAPLLLQALSDEDDRVWQAAVRHLAEVPERDRGVVWTAIVQGPAHRREELIATLERTSAERLASLALEHLTARDPEERTLAITLAGRSGTPEGVRGMIGALQDPAPAVRRAAAAAIAVVRTSDAIPALAGCLYDPDVEVRVEAVRGLSEIDNDDVLNPLISALKDPEVRVRDVASEALVRWQSPAVARRLVMALTQPSLRRPAGEALARMGSSAVEPLVDLLLEEGSEMSETVGGLLRELAGPERFVERLGSMDPAERLRAVEVLGALGGDPALDGLTRALSDPVEGIRVRAVTLIGESGDPRAFDAVKRTFLGDPVQDVVDAAEESLKTLQPGNQSLPDQ